MKKTKFSLKQCHFIYNAMFQREISKIILNCNRVLLLVLAVCWSVKKKIKTQKMTIHPIRNVVSIDM